MSLMYFIMQIYFFWKTKVCIDCVPSSALSSLETTYCIVFRHAFSSDDNDDEDDDDDEGESQLQVNFFSFKTMYHLVSMLLFTSLALYLIEADQGQVNDK